MPRDPRLFSGELRRLIRKLNLKEIPEDYVNANVVFIKLPPFNKWGKYSDNFKRALETVLDLWYQEGGNLMTSKNDEWKEAWALMHKLNLIWYDPIKNEIIPNKTCLLFFLEKEYGEYLKIKEETNHEI